MVNITAADLIGEVEVNFKHGVINLQQRKALLVGVSAIVSKLNGKDGTEEELKIYRRADDSGILLSSSNYELSLSKYGKKTQEIWVRSGKLHREGDKPAVIVYDDDELVIRLESWYDGKIGKREIREAHGY